MNSLPPSTPAYTDTQRREAADWFVMIRDENDPKAESIQAWLRWMDQHEGNRAAFDAVARAWHGAPASAALQMPSAEELLADDYDGDEPVDDWLRRQSADANASTPSARFNPKYIARRAWLAAAAIVIAISAVLTMTRYLDLRSSHPDEFTTKAGEQIEITLSDGSHVWLSPKSRLLVAFDKERRRVELATGEAFFSVRKDHSRPFTVRSAGCEIIAVGTAFNVRAIDERVTVAVSEGVVAVTPEVQRAVETPASVRVASGQQLTFTAQQPIKTLAIVQSPAVGERARWRDGVLVYRDEPLQVVVDDIVRYTNIQIVIADAAIGDLRYTGVIYHHAVREWVSALPESFPVTVVSDGAREIIEAR